MDYRPKLIKWTIKIIQDIGIPIAWSARTAQLEHPPRWKYWDGGLFITKGSAGPTGKYPTTTSPTQEKNNQPRLEWLLTLSSTGYNHLQHELQVLGTHAGTVDQWKKSAHICCVWEEKPQMIQMIVSPDNLKPEDSSHVCLSFKLALPPR